MKKAYIIDEQGFYIKDYLYEEKQELESDIITTEIKQGFYKPKWNGMEWIEGATQEYIDSLTVQTEKEATTEDYLMDLDYRISKMELGLEEK